MYRNKMQRFQAIFYDADANQYSDAAPRKSPLLNFQSAHMPACQPGCRAQKRNYSSSRRVRREGERGEWGPQIVFATSDDRPTDRSTLPHHPYFL